MSLTSLSRFRAAVVFVAPALLIVGFAYHLVAGFVVMALARFVPMGAAQIVLGVAAVVALRPLAYRMWNRAGAVPAGRTVPAA